MIDWLLGHNNDPRAHFKTFVSHAGVFNLVSMYGVTEELWFAEWEFKGTPYDNPELYTRWSPSNFVKNFNTPMLVTQGEIDFRVPVDQGLQLYTALQKRGVESKLDPTSLDALTLNEGLTDEMWELVRLSAELPSAIRRATDALELSIITHDLFVLAQKFNSFYHKYPILNEKDPAERQRRAVCADVFRQTMRTTLGLLGIPVPERM